MVVPTRVFASLNFGSFDKKKNRSQKTKKKRKMVPKDEKSTSLGVARHSTHVLYKWVGTRKALVEMNEEDQERISKFKEILFFCFKFTVFFVNQKCQETLW